MTDGTYNFWIQYSEYDEGDTGPVTTNGLSWTNGPAPSTPAYPDQGSVPNFSKMSVIWTPITPPEPEIVVEQPAGSNLADGSSRNFGTVTVGAETGLTFTIRNIGDADLTGLTLNTTGTNPNDFIVSSGPSAPVSGPDGTTTFTVKFAPLAARLSPYSAQLTPSIPGAALRLSR